MAGCMPSTIVEAATFCHLGRQRGRASVPGHQILSPRAYYFIGGIVEVDATRDGDELAGAECNPGHFRERGADYFGAVGGGEIRQDLGELRALGSICGGVYQGY
jgi:hypothetical protein